MHIDQDVERAGIRACEFLHSGREFGELVELAGDEEGVEEGVEGFDGAGGAEGRDGVEHVDGTCGEAGAAVGGDDVAEEGFRDEEAGFAAELLEDLFHLGEHFGAGEFGDDEVVGEEGVAEGARVGVGIGVWVRVEEELKGEGWVLLGTEERGESEGRYGFRSGDHC